MVCENSNIKRQNILSDRLKNLRSTIGKKSRSQPENRGLLHKRCHDEREKQITKDRKAGDCRFYRQAEPALAFNQTLFTTTSTHAATCVSTICSDKNRSQDCGKATYQLSLLTNHPSWGQHTPKVHQAHSPMKIHSIKLMEESPLNNDESFITALWTNHPLPLILFKKNGKILNTNPTLDSLLQYEPRELNRQNICQLIPDEIEDQGDLSQIDLIEILSQIKNENRPLHARKKNGESVRVEFSVLKIQEGDDSGYLGFWHDVTDRLALAEQQQEVEKLNALGQLAGGVAHDFNNLLMVVLGYTKRAVEKYDDKEVVLSSLLEVIRAAENARDLTAQLLAFGRRQPLDQREILFNSALDDAAGLLVPLLDANIRLILRPFRGENVWMKIDKSLLTQAIINLAINGRDALNGTGYLEISTEIVEPSERLLRKYPTMTEERYATVIVKDQGTGMDEETIARIFEPFFTTKTQGNGTGLGLSMVHGFVMQSGGILDVESTPGEGTTFTLYFPVSEKPETVSSLVLNDDWSGKGETILLAEDNDSLRSFLTTMIEDFGYHVLAARNGFEALELESIHKGRIDLLLSDVVMPTLGGFELAKALQETRPDIRIILMSGYPTRGDGKQAEKPEGVLLLQKPIDRQHLAQVIRETLGQVSSANTDTDTDTDTDTIIGKEEGEGEAK
ncbi:MAG: response regulator [Parvibaculum sp.]|nr:response regulator [Parvibaculum sp.]